MGACYIHAVFTAITGTLCPFNHSTYIRRAFCEISFLITTALFTDINVTDFANVGVKLLNI